MFHQLCPVAPDAREARWLSRVFVLCRYHIKRLEELEMKARLLSISAAAVLALAAGSANADLELAKKSGCLACHSVEKKVVGPAWQDVANKYKGDASAKATLVDKVKKGGKGNWTEVTGGVPMPPYSPRVADADIEKLVDFVLGLAK